LDKDGDLEMIVPHAASGWAHRTYAYHPDGSIVDGFPLTQGWPRLTNADNNSAAPILDLEGDGFPEVITSC